MKKCIIFLLFLSISINLIAQHPWMIKDINATRNGSVLSPVGNNWSTPVNPYIRGNYHSVNGVAVFSANDGINGDGLWRSDGTAAGTYLLKLFPSTTQTVISIYEAGALLYFTVANTLNLSQGQASLWRTDGTVAGTFKILSNQNHLIDPFLCQQFSDTHAAIIGSEFYFMVTDTLPGIDNTHDRVYKTDGTINGTSMYYEPPGARNNGTNQVISYINQINASGANLYIIKSETTRKNLDSLLLFPTSLARADGVNPPVTIFTPPLGARGGSTGMILSMTADVNGYYLLMNGTITDNIGLFRLYPNETTPVQIDTIAWSNDLGIAANFNFNPSIGNRFFYRSALGKLKVTDGTINGFFNFEEPNTTNDWWLGGIANNKILVSNSNHSFFWDGASGSSYIGMDSLGIAIGSGVQLFESNNKLFYFGDQTNIAWTSELDGSNFLRVFYFPSNTRGALTSNGIVAQFSTGSLNSFDAGTEPGIFKTNFKIFTGNISHDWTTAGNWSPAGVPLAIDDVVIPALGAAKLPVITSAATCRNLTLCNGLLTITGANLDINGNVDNYLSTVTGTGSVTLKSSTGAKISGYPQRPFFDVANIYIDGTDVSFGTPNVTFNSPVTFKTDNKILAIYNTSTAFNKNPFITGYNANRFLVTSGNLIYNNFNNAGSAPKIDSIVTMPIGNSINAYTPISFVSHVDPIYETAINVSVADSINKNGANGSLVTSTVVAKCWTIYSTGILNTKLSFGWNASNETPGFNHNSSHIAYNSNGIGDGTWIGGTNQAASLQNGTYSLSQRYDQLPYGRYIVLNDSVDLALATSNITNTQAINGNTTYNDGISIINSITANGTTPVSGNITSTVIIDSTVQSYNGKPYVQRHFNIEPSVNANAATATVTLYYSQNEFNAYNIAAENAGLALLPINSLDAANNKKNLLINQYHGTGTTPGNYTGYTGTGATKMIIVPNLNWNNNNLRWEASFAVTGFSGFYATTIAGILPVKLTSFTASLKNNKSILNWVTSTEINNKGYDIERSNNADEFKKIGYTPGMGSSSFQQQYQFVDAEPNIGINYYRLKQIDFTGLFTYSMVRSINNLNAGNTLSIYPNPATNIVYVNTKSLTGTIQITDMAGHVLLTNLKTGSNTAINISKLPGGTYICKIGSTQIMFVRQ